VRVGRETKGRAGKGVTIVHGLPLAADALNELATRLKKRCGSGGTVRAGAIEIQGEHRDTLVAELTRLGYRARRAGG
jgi:translation initiation factor 1